MTRFIVAMLALCAGLSAVRKGPPPGAHAKAVRAQAHDARAVALVKSEAPATRAAR
jgi:hypothetical protein